MIITGHRGAKGLAPENTLASIQAALDAEVQEIEIDVRVTKDGVVVLSHDPAEIATTNYVDLEIATLHNAVQLINRRVPLIIEVKSKEPVSPIITEIKQFLNNGWQPHDFFIASFSQKTLCDIHRELPEITAVVNERWSGLRAIYRMKQLNTRRVSMKQQFLWFGFVRAMHRRGYQLNAFTLNNPAKAYRWQRYGLHSAITDFPDRYQLKNK